MTGAAGVVSGLIGFIGILAACIRSARGEDDRAFQNEACAVLWFILVAVLLK